MAAVEVGRLGPSKTANLIGQDVIIISKVLDKIEIIRLLFLIFFIALSLGVLVRGQPHKAEVAIIFGLGVSLWLRFS